LEDARLSKSGQIMTDLFSYTPPPPFAKGSDTSMAAANRIEPHLSALQRRVYEFIADRGLYGATDEQIAFGLQMNPSTVRPRRGELRDAGHIKLAPFTRPSRAGRAMNVWVATP
jgi:hypothetical protein